MSPERLTEYLHSQIPLSSAMGVIVASSSPSEVVLRAPLAPNINHKKTMFGGSGACILTLAAWTLLTVRLSGGTCCHEIVIANGATNFVKPVHSDFEAVSRFEGSNWLRFEESLQRKGRGRIELTSELICGGAVCATFTGQFVATREA